MRRSPAGNAKSMGGVPFSSNPAGVDNGNMRMRSSCSSDSALLLDCPGGDGNPSAPAAAASQGPATPATAGGSFVLLFDTRYDQRFSCLSKDAPRILGLPETHACR